MHDYDGDASSYRSIECVMKTRIECCVAQFTSLAISRGMIHHEDELRWGIHTGDLHLA